MNRLGSKPPYSYMITNGEARDQDFEQKQREILRSVSAAVEAGLTLVQVREKQLSARRLTELVDAVVAVTRAAASGVATKVLVNDRADIALAAGADGVHLTVNSMPVTAIRESFPPDFIIGVSTHTFEEVASAARDGADFAVFGPVFETPGKEPQGLEMLARACEEVAPFPVLAIGGVDANNAPSAIAAGASGIAAIRALNDADTLKDLVRQLG